MLTALEKTSSFHIFSMLGLSIRLNKVDKKIIDFVVAFAKFYCTCSKSSPHTQYYIDPLTGRIVPVKKSEFE